HYAPQRSDLYDATQVEHKNDACQFHHNRKPLNSALVLGFFHRKAPLLAPPHLIAVMSKVVDVC
ncbi:hypothetical protein, partial [Lysinibacillus sp. D4B1_S16]|uniref:hypothetical protein n=1 Tax=Lysinibacillus sp. D4B1_S16 TaxID=2941231 RepID=UPI0020BEDFF0